MNLVFPPRLILASYTQKVHIAKKAMWTSSDSYSEVVSMNNCHNGK